MRMPPMSAGFSPKDISSVSPYVRIEAGFDVLPQLSGQRGGAFDHCRVPLVFETHEPLEICQHSQCSAAWRLRECSGDLARPILIEDTACATQPEQLARDPFDFLARSHQLASCAYIASCVAVSSAMRR